MWNPQTWWPISKTSPHMQALFRGPRDNKADAPPPPLEHMGNIALLRSDWLHTPMFQPRFPPCNANVTCCCIWPPHSRQHYANEEEWMRHRWRGWVGGWCTGGGLGGRRHRPWTATVTENELSHVDEVRGEVPTFNCTPANELGPRYDSHGAPDAHAGWRGEPLKVYTHSLYFPQSFCTEKQNKKILWSANLNPLATPQIRLVTPPRGKH